MTDDQRETGARADDTSGVRADRPRQCATCGERIALEQWHPVVARTDEEDTFELYAFCSEDCRRAWESG